MFSLKKNIYLPVLSGTILGSLLYVTLLSNYNIIDINICKIEDDMINNNYILYMVQQKIIIIIIMLIIVIISTYKISVSVFSILLGIYYACVSCFLFCQYGLESYKMIIKLFIPHYLLYLFSLYFIGSKILYINDHHNNYKNNNKFNNINYFVKILLAVCIIIMGCISEIFYKKFF